MAALTDKVNALAAVLAQVDVKKQELLDLFADVDAHNEALRLEIETTRPVQPIPVEQPVPVDPPAPVE